VFWSKSFSQIDIDKVNKISGMDISFNYCKTDKEAKSLAELGLPFKKN
jgi:large subunit ribosomal protein L5